MPFGKFIGECLCDIPTDYLAWLARLPDLRPPLRGAVRAELSRRRQHRNRGPEPEQRRYPPPVDWQAIISRARRAAEAIPNYIGARRA